MPWKSRWNIDIPTLSLPSYLFTSPSAQLPEKPILIDAERPEHHLTHHSYREWSKRLACGLLRNAGFEAGDRLLLYSGNTVFFPVVLQGTVMAGGIFTGANPSYVARELAYQLEDSGAKILICGEGSLDTALEAADSIHLPRERVFVMGDGFEVFEDRAKSVRGIRHWTSLLASEEEGAKFEWEQLPTREQMDRTAVLNYSSGTTGVPKGVEITHLNYVSNCMQTEHTAQLSPDYASFLQRARGLSFLPMYHAYGQTHHGVSMVLKGIPVYLMRKFDFVKMLEYIQRYRITSLALVPPIAVALTKRPEVKNYDLSCVESAGCGAAPLSGETVREFNKMFNNRFQLKQGWGMTEITCSAFGWDPNRDSEASRVGELNANIEAVLVDPDDPAVEITTPDARGELWVRGPNVMKGYWRKPEATRETLTEEGWLKTGDIAIRNTEGLLAIVDRRKELIKVKGNQVAPAELEGVLLDHPGVVDAAVVGVVISGEESPRAYVVLREGHSVSPQDIANWMSKRVARHKRLTGGVVCVDNIPKNPSGKILRKFLRDRAKEEVGDKEPKDSRL
ncbi:hypothetical protein LTR37_006702 [Vermiconidia calcicola]|uniref:Uncharacterized protein n=1 Tax=Vermiconidia calcicola TaxID=1690605 RepID=A0ACC3NFC0_9PEZI|nr:hypothetical protein LTR37_006702 [Vermiconidia calcicola]